MMKPYQETQYLQLEIRAEALTQLINSGSLVVEDLRALNRCSQEKVRTLLLNSLKVMTST